MDPISTLGCRLYQIAFRIALPVLPYRRPVLLEDIEALRDVFLGRGIRRVLLVTDPSAQIASVDNQGMLSDRMKVPE